jgi:hypothetical protein
VVTSPKTAQFKTHKPNHTKTKMKRAKITLKNGDKIHAVWNSHAKQWRQDIDALKWIRPESIKTIITIA